MADVIYSPMKGTAIKMEEAKDPVFAQKMLGDGVCVYPEFKTGLFAKAEPIFAPVDGEVILVFKEKHAIGFRTESGKEILIHMGIDTVELKGAPFKITAAVGDKVTAGQQIGEVKWKDIVKAGKDTVCPVIWTNGLDDDCVALPIKPVNDHGPVDVKAPLYEID